MVLLAIVGSLVVWAVALAGSAVALPLNCPLVGSRVTCTFSFTGAEQTFVVPSGISSVQISAVGAPGSSASTAGGAGGTARAELSGLTSGSTLYVEVGGPGQAYASSTGGGGWNGGGASGQGLQSVLAAGGGGGASDVRTVSCGSSCAAGGAAASLASRLVVAGGGGAGGLDASLPGLSIAGGVGGAAGSAGGAGADSQYGDGGGRGGGAGTRPGGPPGTAGAAIPGGVSGDAGQSGGLGDGGAGGNLYGAGGGGGGGYYGGGGGGGSAATLNDEQRSWGGGGGGGGGSSYAPGGSTGVAASTGTPPSVSISFSARPPMASISSPASGGIYPIGQHVPTRFACADSSDGSGIHTCRDSNGSTSPGALKTTTVGAQTYTVTATSKDAQSATAKITYTVAGAPGVVIASPRNGARYAFARQLRASYHCHDGASGPGIATCTATTADGSPVDTTRPGPHTFTVTATSKDGQHFTASVSYTILPNENFSLSHLRTNADGTISFQLTVPGPGRIDVLETAWMNNLAHAAVMLQPATGRFVFARASATTSHPGTLNIHVTPNQRGHQLVHHHTYQVVLRLWISYSPTGGHPVGAGLYGLHLACQSPLTIPIGPGKPTHIKAPPACRG